MRKLTICITEEEWEKLEKKMKIEDGTTDTDLVREVFKSADCNPCFIDTDMI